MFARITLIAYMTMGFIIPGFPLPGWAADKVWDNELKRHLTD